MYTRFHYNSFLMIFSVFILYWLFWRTLSISSWIVLLLITIVLDFVQVADFSMTNWIIVERQYNFFYPREEYRRVCHKMSFGKICFAKKCLILLTPSASNIYIYIYIYIYISDRSRGPPEGSLFNSYYTEV